MSRKPLAAVKNGLPYLSKHLFCEAMEDIASQTTLVTGHPWPELKETIHVQKTYPMIHAVQEVVPTPAPPIQVSYPGRSVSLNPHQARQEVMQIFDSKRSRLSGLCD